MINESANYGHATAKICTTTVNRNQISRNFHGNIQNNCPLMSLEI